MKKTFIQLHLLQASEINPAKKSSVPSCLLVIEAFIALLTCFASRKLVTVPQTQSGRVKTPSRNTLNVFSLPDEKSNYHQEVLRFFQEPFHSPQWFRAQRFPEKIETPNQITNQQASKFWTKFYEKETWLLGTIRKSCSAWSRSAPAKIRTKLVPSPISFSCISEAMIISFTAGCSFCDEESQLQYS